MKPVGEDHVVADSDDITEARGYRYFPSSAVRIEWLEKTPGTTDDLECPHGVQFYDVVIDGTRHPRVRIAAPVDGAHRRPLRLLARRRGRLRGYGRSDAT